jgi:hypothetical protein
VAGRIRSFGKNNQLVRDGYGVLRYSNRPMKPMKWEMARGYTSMRMASSFYVTLRFAEPGA